jgi:putative (di)nucleoside polyphosphate hydrolase
MKKKDEIPLRIGVGIALLNDSNEVFVGKRIDNPKRELEEETGIKNVKLIKEIEGWIIYDLPKNLLGKIWKGKYRGQKQKWFIMKFLGNNNEININTKKPEFMNWKWIKPSKLPEVAVNFKIGIYKKISKEVSNFITN